MPIPNTSKKPTRYMDFISRKPSENSDPLASRPNSRPVKQPKPIVKKAPSVADQIPAKGAHIEKPPVKAPKSEQELVVKKDDDRPLISRKPATSRDLYAESINPDKPKTIIEKPVDDLAIKASAALSGTSQPAEKTSDGSAYSLNGKSPFLPNYIVDKRPLSNSVPAKRSDGQFEKLSYLGVSDQSADSSHRKNVYERAEEPEGVSGNETIKIIDDTQKKHGAPTWLIIILTIILGAAAGAGVYFLLPK